MLVQLLYMTVNRNYKAKMEAPGQIRESVIAGSWYPGKKEELAKAVDSFLKNAPRMRDTSIQAM
jgi:hypothetical protein